MLNSFPLVEGFSGSFPFVCLGSSSGNCPGGAFCFSDSTDLSDSLSELSSESLSSSTLIFSNSASTTCLESSLCTRCPSLYRSIFCCPSFTSFSYSVPFLLSL